MLEDIFVFETSGSRTPGDAGSGPSNLAVLTVNSQREAVKVPPGNLFFSLNFSGGSVAVLCARGGRGG